MEFPLNDLSIILGLGLADINCFFVEGMYVILFGVHRYFLNHEFLAILVVIGLLYNQGSIAIVVPIDCQHLLGES